jgi:hypothetical protein
VQCRFLWWFFSYLCCWFLCQTLTYRSSMKLANRKNW